MTATVYSIVAAPPKWVVMLENVHTGVTCTLGQLVAYDGADAARKASTMLAMMQEWRVVGIDRETRS
jgi:hypothetical protein